MAGKSEEVYQLAKRKIRYLGSVSSGENKALLAEIRHGAGKKPGDDPRLWGILFDTMPESMMSQQGVPTYEEWAIYIAMTMYAVHQQGHDVKTDNMNAEGMSIGKAVAMLVTGDDDRERVERRFNNLATADNMQGVSHYLRELIHLLRADDIGLDYALLAKDLYVYQFPELAAGVRLHWGQDFYSALNKKNKEASENE